MRLMRTPRSLEIDITNSCNLRCAYCSHFDSAGEVHGDLPREEWLTFFAELHQGAVMEVTLCGGEPFMREDLPELIQGIVKNGMRFSILSNGTLITGETAALLAASGRCNRVQVSIDGANPASHDACRGKGNFRRALAGVEALKRHGLTVAVRVTLHRHNVRELEAIARFLLEEVGLPGFSTNAASHMGLCRQNAGQVALSIDERSWAMETLLRLSREYPGRINAAAGPLAEARTWSEMARAHREGQPNLPGRGYLRACGGVMTKLAVRADGVMVPCTQMSHLPLGRINQDRLMEVWQHHPELRRLRERQQIPLGEFEFCRGCAYIPYCTGNCPALAYTLLGEENHPSPDACLKRFLEAGGRLPGSPVNTGGMAACR